MSKLGIYLGLLLFFIAQSSLSAQDIPQECYQFDSDANPQFICDGVCPACDDPSFIFTFKISTFFVEENDYFLFVDDGTIPPLQINPSSSAGGAGFDQELNEDPFGSTIRSISFVLYEGCYSFRITDNFGDGVFDIFGDGFFSLEIDGVEVHSGVNFGHEDVFNFCLTTESCEDGIQNGEEEGIDCGGPSCEPCVTDTETCEDGIMNGDETGIDCGGALCEPCVTESVSCEDGIMNGDEQGIDCGGALCEPCDCMLSLVYDNIVCDDNGTATPNDDLFYVDVTLTGVGNGDMWRGGLGNQDMDGNYGETITFGPFLTNSGSNISGWFRDVNNTNCAIDIVITAPNNCSVGPCNGQGSEPCFTCEDGILNGEEENIDCGGPFCEPCNNTGDISSPIHSNDAFVEIEISDELLTLFPNPTRDVINISLADELNENAEVSITDLNGNILKRIIVGDSFDEKMTLDVSQYAPGFYFINLKSDSKFESKKFIVIK